MIDASELEQGVGSVRRFDNVERNARRREHQRRDPALEPPLVLEVLAGGRLEHRGAFADGRAADH